MSFVEMYKPLKRASINSVVCTWTHGFRCVASDRLDGVAALIKGISSKRFHRWPELIVTWRDFRVNRIAPMEIRNQYASAPRKRQAVSYGAAARALAARGSLYWYTQVVQIKRVRQN